MLNPKKQVKGIAVVVLFLLGVAELIGFNITPAYAAKGASVVGVVNFQLLVSKHPDMAAVQKTMDAAAAQAKADFDLKSVAMNDKDRQALYQKMQQDIQQKNQELLKPINDKVMAAVKSVADSEGLTIIIDEDSTVYGGQDITDEVMKVITGK